jgi:protein ImuB
VRFDTPLALAQALVPNAYVEPFDPLRDYRALTTLATWCIRLSPRVGIDYELAQAHRTHLLLHAPKEQYGIVIDLTGTERFHGQRIGSLERLVEQLYEIFKRRAHIALTPTIGSAWALSRYGAAFAPRVISHPHTLATALMDLPVEALRLSHDSLKAVGRVGITTIGELVRIPHHTLAQQFGKHTLFRVRQAYGEIDEGFETIEEQRTFVSSRIFEPPLIKRQSITHAITHLFRDIIEQLIGQRKRARYFRLTISETNAHTIQKELPLRSASNDPAHLLSIIEPIIDGITFFGEVREIILSADQIEVCTDEQRTFSASPTVDTSQKARQELLNNLCMRIGKDRVTFATLHQSYIPERSFSYQPVLQEALLKERATPYNDYTRPPYSLAERPSHIFQHPEQITTLAMLPDRPPSFIQWRGKRLSIVAGRGPERIAPEWWFDNLQETTASERDYFTVQDELGRWLWVYRENRTHSWFIHGIWV